MNRKQRINNLLLNKFKDFSIDIIDNSHLHSGHNNFTGTNETHLKIIFNAKTEKNINRINIHRTINTLLKEEFNKGLHSLEIKINLL